MLTDGGVELSNATDVRKDGYYRGHSRGSLGDLPASSNDGLAPGDSLEIPVDGWLDLADIYVDVDTNGEGVDFYAVKV